MRWLMPDPLIIPATILSGRVETGPVQFGDDWPGLFIRGDNAFGMKMVIDSAITQLDMTNPAAHLTKIQLEGISQTLGGCIVTPDENDG